MICNLRFQICGLLLGFATFICLEHTVSAETRLRWKFSEGDKLQVVVDQHTMTKTSGAGKPTGIDIKMQLHMGWSIDSVADDGSARITQKFERFAVTMKSGTAEAIEFDSDSATKPGGSAANIAAAVSPLIGVEFSVSMTNRGAIREVKLSDAAAEAFGSVESPALKQLFSAEGISQLLSQAAIEFPEDAAKTDSTWSLAITTPSSLGILKQDRTYTLATPEEVDGKTLERINLSGQLTIEPNEEAPSKSKLIDQELAGSIFFDAEAGRLVSSRSTQKLTTERPYREFKFKVETTAETTTAVELLAKEE